MSNHSDVNVLSSHLSNHFEYLIQVIYSISPSSKPNAQSEDSILLFWQISFNNFEASGGLAMALAVASARTAAEKDADNAYLQIER